MDTQQSEDNLAQLLKYGRCTGAYCNHTAIAEEDHTCPFAEEIHGDSISLCNCCEQCTDECAMDI